MAVAVFLRSMVLGGSLLVASCADPEDDSAAAATPVAAPSPEKPLSRAAAPPGGRPSLVLPVGLADPSGCNAPEAEAFIGRDAGEAARAALAEAVAPVAAIRWVGPGDATTDDYRPERLNVMLDVDGKIVSAHCG